jgi:hypothetical protein
MNDANVLCWRDFVVDPPSNAFVELFEFIDIRDWYEGDFQMHIGHFRSLGLTRHLFSTSICFANLLHVSITYYSINERPCAKFAVGALAVH